MQIFETSPALVLLSLRARVRGQKPHLPAFNHAVLDCIERGAFNGLKPEDFAEARRMRLRNNRVNAAIRNREANARAGK